MEKIRVAINGFGRIGRTFFRQTFDRRDMEIVAVNDPFMTLEEAVDSLQHDSVYRNFGHVVSAWRSMELEYLGIDVGTMGKKSVEKLSYKDPAKLPWKNLEIDIVVEASGVFTKSEELIPHLTAGAKRVVITAPTKDPKIPMATPNIVPDWKALRESRASSNASCSTNATAPIIKIFHEVVGVETCVFIGPHAYTNGQGLVDGPGKKGDPLRGRAAAINIIPTHTGAADAIGVLIPELKGRFIGTTLRVPVPVGSIAYLIISPLGHVDGVEEVNDLLKDASQKEEWKGILEVTEKALASTDIIGKECGSLVDLSQTNIVGEGLDQQIMVAAWYDNEWGYVSMLIKHILMVAKYL